MSDIDVIHSTLRACLRVTKRITPGGGGTQSIKRALEALERIEAGRPCAGCVWIGEGLHAELEGEHICGQ